MSYQDLVRISLFAALIAVLGLIPKLDLPFTAGVPITAQTLGVMLAGLILGARNGGLAVLLFLFVVALGAPVLSGGRGGLGVFFGPTIGFLVGWVAGAWACGFLNTQFRKWAPARPYLCALIAALLGGIVVIYAFGIPGIVLKTELTFVKAFLAAAVFVPGDILKCLIAAWIASRIRPRLL
ncbi:MAG: biotin transporter BioY [Burkholderiaceae bacterium]|nr:biotin transporter BioY [Betaproteobacteria bacterium]